MKHTISAAAAIAALWIVLSLWFQAGGPVQARDPAGRETSFPALETAAADSRRPETAAAPEVPSGEKGPTAEDGPIFREHTAPAQEEIRPETGFDAAFRLPVLADGEVVSMALDAYLTGVLLAELPASFSPEAKKAQTVACRTYALYNYAHRRHGGAAVCTCSACCQGWRDPTGASPEALEAAARAVSETDGLVILYDGVPIDATFFSCSGGQTEAAAAVWGRDLPYLQPVDSPGEEEAAHFTDSLRLPLDEFRRILREADPKTVFPEALGAWVGEVTLTPGGGVDRIVLGGRPFTGKQLRKLFGLRSTAFRLTLTETEAVFETRGSGHRVGMSQWGAEAMARAGAGFAEILTHYYRGVTVGAWGGK